METTDKTKKTFSRRKSVYEKVMENDVDLYQRVFNTYSKGKDYMLGEDLKHALQDCDIIFRHDNIYYKMLSSLKNQTGHISFFDFTKIIVKKKKEDESNDDIKDAFIALGGDEDLGGNIDADRLIDIIKNQFDMTINIEDMIKAIDVDGSGEIEFGEFQDLLECQGENPEIDTHAHFFMCDDS